MQGNDAIKNATSVLDYVFRELAISYLSRHDLAHVSPESIGFDAIGKGDNESKAPSSHGAAMAAARVVSKGLVRGKPTNLMAIEGGVSFEARASDGTVATAYATVGATALKSGALVDESPMTIGDASTDTAFSGVAFQAVTAKKPAPSALDKRTEARMKGYVGEACPECANFTLVRNGTCLKCDTCGSTTGCS